MIVVKLVIRKAENYAPGHWSVEYGPDSAVYANTALFKTFDEMKAYLEKTADHLAADSRMQSWRGFEIRAEHVEPRKPRGWDKHYKTHTHARRALKGVIRG